VVVEKGDGEEDQDQDPKSGNRSSPDQKAPRKSGDKDVHMYKVDTYISMYICIYVSVG
jgi:hypothetical protein